MADFKAFRRNIGTDVTPRFLAYITMSNCGVRKDGSLAIAECATVEELEESVAALALSLEEARKTARAFLEENN